MASPFREHVSPTAQRRPPAFAHIRRLHDDRFPHEIAAILPGEYFVSEEPMVVYTVLGSCVAACIRDPVAGVGGMNHFMLPAPRGESASDSWEGSARYGCFAMEVLLNEIVKRGGRKERLEVKVFGGGKIYEGQVDIGGLNAVWILEYLKREGFRPVTRDLGEVYPRKVYYFTQSGRVLLKKIERLKNRTICEREAQYHDRLQRRADGDVTLF